MLAACQCTTRFTCRTCCDRCVARNLADANTNPPVAPTSTHLDTYIERRVLAKLAAWVEIRETGDYPLTVIPGEERRAYRERAANAYRAVRKADSKDARIMRLETQATAQATVQRAHEERALIGFTVEEVQEIYPLSPDGTRCWA